MITVILPTTNRPDYLRTALQCIRRQRAVAQIAEVLVSENAESRLSEAVCEEFKDLPIRYIFRDPPVREHFLLLLKEAKNELVAVLFDDDWWAPSHIENGLKWHAQRSDISCYFAAYFMVESERSLLQCHPTIEFWIGAGCPSFLSEWKLTLTDVVSACLVDVPCTYSSMIARRATLLEAYFETTSVGNMYDSDRVITLELSKKGPIVVNPIPEVFVRFHPGQEKNRFSPEMRRRYKRMSIEHLLAICKQHDIKLGQEFDRRITAAPESVRESICQIILADYDDLTGQIGSKVLEAYEKQNETRPSTTIRDMLKYLAPPAAWELGKRVLRRHGGAVWC